MYPHFFWSDSTTILQWLRKDICDLKLYVANRVRSIRANTKIENWAYMKINENSADLVSRGLGAKDMVNASLWWNGPIWLGKPMGEWPIPKQIVYSNKNEEVNKELKIHSILMAKNDLVIHMGAGKNPVALINYSNNLEKLERILSYVLRFISSCKMGYRRKPRRAIEQGKI